MPSLMICNSDIKLGVMNYAGDSMTILVDGVDIPAVVPVCSSGWVQVAYAPPFDASQIDPMICTQLFGAGFLLFLTPWAAAWGLSQMLKLIR